jgi:hypothetical protein
MGHWVIAVGACDSTEGILPYMTVTVILSSSSPPPPHLLFLTFSGRPLQLHHFSQSSVAGTPHYLTTPPPITDPLSPPTSSTADIEKSLNPQTLTLIEGVIVIVYIKLSIGDIVMPPPPCCIATVLRHYLRL